MTAYRILSLDGGGIRGIIMAVILERIELARPGFLSQVNLFAGTSTGGLMALGFASGMTPTQLRSLYEDDGRFVFSDTLVDNLRDIGMLIGAKYSIENLEIVLGREFGDMTLGDLPGKVLISSFDLDSLAEPPESRSWKAKFFHNYPGAGSDYNEKVVDVAIRTAVAPTHFPVYQGYIDGGVVASNPSMCALAEALHPASGGQELGKISLLSLGTGHIPRYLTTQDGDWGLLQWAPHLVHLVMEGSSDLVDYQCQQLLGEHYKRINVQLPYPIGMDQVERIPTLKRVAYQYDISGTVRWIDANYV